MNTRGDVFASDLDRNQARSVADSLGPGHFPVPGRYERPVVSVESAAERALEVLTQRARQYPGLTFGSMRLRSDEVMWFTFIMPCQEWQAEGLIPGGLLCSIDKVDGHVWTPDEMEAFWLALADS